MLQTPHPSQEALLKLLTATGIGWWKINFQTETILCSELLQKMLGYGRNTIPLALFDKLIAPEYRLRLRTDVTALKVQESFDEIFPLITPQGEIWIHLILVEKYVDSTEGNVIIFGSAQRIFIHNTQEAEQMRLSSNYAAVLRENRHMELLLEQLPIGYIRIKLLFDKNGEAVDFLFAYMNKIAATILGEHISQFTGKTARELGVLQPTHLRVMQSLSLSAHREDIWPVPGSDKTCQSILYNTPDDHSEIVVLCRDISDMVNANKALDKSEKLLRNIFRSIPVGIEIYDKDGCLFDANEETLKIFGIDKMADTQGACLFDDANFPEDIKLRIHRHEILDFSIKYDFKRAHYYKSHRSDTVDLTTRIRYLYDQAGELTNYILIHIDNTQQNFSQNRIAEFENIFKMVSEISRAGYANYNLFTKTGYSQGVWQRNYGEREGASIKDIVGVYAHVHPEDRQRMMKAWRHLQDGTRDTIADTIRILHDDGHCSWTRTNLFCRDYRPQEGIIEVVGINYDITELKETEHKLIAAKEHAEESSKLKSAFLASMSHEIRTPLNAIVGFSELLSQENDPSVRHQYMEIINKNNTLLLQIISDVLDLACIESEKQKITYTKFHIKTLCQEIVTRFQPTTPEAVTLNITTDLPDLQILSYKRGLIQVLSNFVSNAVKFTKEGTITIGFQHKKNKLVIFVSDTGIGIPEKSLNQIFERFIKLDTFSQGTGLGLSICKSIAKQLGGRIGVESQVGQGSKFWISIPLK